MHEGLCGLLLLINAISDQVRRRYLQRFRQFLQGLRVSSPFQPLKPRDGPLSQTGKRGKLTLRKALALAGTSKAEQGYCSVDGPSWLLSLVVWVAHGGTSCMLVLAWEGYKHDAQSRSEHL